MKSLRHLLMIAVVSAAILLPAQTQAAASPYRWAAYEVQVDFPKDQIQATMIVRWRL